MTGNVKLDSTDRQIISALSHEPQVSNREIATRLGVAESTISIRIDSLIKAKVIKPSVQQNVAKAGYGMVGWIDIECDYSDIPRIAAEIADIDVVFSISQFFENPFLMVMVFTRNIVDLREFVERRIGNIQGITSASTDISLGEICIKSGIASL